MMSYYKLHNEDDAKGFSRNPCRLQVSSKSMISR